MNRYYIATNNDEKNKKMLLKLISKDQNSILAHKLLAKSYEKDGKIEFAIDEYLRVVDLNNDDIKTYFKLSKTYFSALENRASAQQTKAEKIHTHPERQPERNAGRRQNFCALRDFRNTKT